MASRKQLNIIPNTRAVSVDDINVVYHILNGSFSNVRGAVTETATRGLGMSVQLTGYDGRLSTGLIDVSKYALEVRNRESTARLTAAFRDSNNSIIAEVRAGLLRAVDPDASTPTTPLQVIVRGTPAGGVLGGTYPNPTFALATEYYRIYPAMIMAWYGDATTTNIGGNFELVNCPGWVLCNGATVTMRDSSVMVTPNMADRLPIGPGSVAYKSTGGNAWAGVGGLSQISTAHTHGFTHEHTIPTHTHDISHTHEIGNHTHTISHRHSLGNHHHTGNTLSWPHGHAHTHDVANHSHTLVDHDHTSGTYAINSTERTGSDASGTGGGDNNIPHGSGPGSTNVNSLSHTHTIANKDVDGESGSAHIVSSGADFLSTETKTGLSTDERINTTGSVSITAAWTGTTSTPVSNEVGVSDNQTGDTNTANTGSTVSGSTGAASPSTSGGITPYSTTTQSNNTTTSQSVSTINVQPPVLAWHWLFKL